VQRRVSIISVVVKFDCGTITLDFAAVDPDVTGQICTLRKCDRPSVQSQCDPGARNGLQNKMPLEKMVVSRGIRNTMKVHVKTA
jgi:hypothetical protein